MLLVHLQYHTVHGIFPILKLVKLLLFQLYLMCCLLSLFVGHLQLEIDSSQLHVDFLNTMMKVCLGQRITDVLID